MTDAEPTCPHDAEAHRVRLVQPLPGGHSLLVEETPARTHCRYVLAHGEGPGETVACFEATEGSGEGVGIPDDSVADIVAYVAWHIEECRS